MPSSSLLLSVGTLISALSSPALATLYKQQDVYQGDSFLQGFDFLVTDKDPTNGFVSYIGEQQATTEKLLRKEGGAQYIGVDYTTKLTVGGKGRKSVRIETKTNYNQGLYVVDIKHMPGGICGTWPAFWSLGSGEWPKNGEIDIIEGVNTNTANKFVLHTDTQCSVDGLDQKDPQNLYNCALDSPSSTAGCDVNSAQPNTYGSSFNDNGGGVYAMEWTSDFIKIWFFPRNAIPSTLNDATPDTSKFGKPNANFKGNCDIAKKFINQRFIFDTTFCGDWAGNVYAQSGCPMYTGLSGYDSCIKYVAENPGAFEEAYWLINSFKTYTKSTGTISSSSSTISSTASSTVGSSTASSSSAASSSVASSSVVSSSHSASASVSASSDVSASTQYPTGSTTPHESDISKTSTQYPVETPYETEKYPASSTPQYPVETPYETEKYPASSTPQYPVETPYETEKYPASSTPCESSSSAHYAVETPYETEKYPASSTPCESEASSSATGYPGHQPSSKYPVEKPSYAPLYPVGASSAPLYPTAAPSVKPYEHSTTVTTTYTTTYVDVCSTGYTTITTTHTATYCPDATPTPVSGYPAPPPPGFTVTEKYCEHGCGSYPTTVTVTIPCTACGIKPTPASYEVYTPQPSAPGHAHEHKSFPPGPYETVVTLSTKHVVPTPSSYPGCNGKDCPHETPSYQGSYPGCSGKDCSPEASSYPVNHNNVPHGTGYIHYSTGALPTKTSGYPSIPEFTGAASNVKSGVVAVVGAAFAVAML